jgi:hypothetical protein
MALKIESALILQDPEVVPALTLHTTRILWFSIKWQNPWGAPLIQRNRLTIMVRRNVYLFSKRFEFCR